MEKMARRTNHPWQRTADSLTTAPPGDVEKNGSTTARLTQPSGEGNTLEMWVQIRRTEEELMEMGTMDNTLLQDEYAVTKGLVSAVETLIRTGAASTSETMPCFI
jgi:hypothetical protein